MGDGMLRQSVDEATALIDAGEQGAALSLLTHRIAELQGVHDETEACAVAEATQIIVRLSGPVASMSELDAHLERMNLLVAGIESEALSDALAEAELQRIEWIHDVELDDAELLVDLLRAAEELVHRFAAPGASDRVRTVWAEAKLTDLDLRTRLGKSGHERAVGFETLAMALEGESVPRLRTIRTIALMQAAGLRSAQDDTAASELLWRRAATAAIDSRSAVARHRAALALFDLAAAAGDPQAWSRSAAVLDEQHWRDAAGVNARCAYLSGLLDRLPPAAALERAPGLWRTMIVAHAGGEHDARAALWSWITSGASDGETSPFIGPAVIAIADDTASTDDADETIIARLRLALRRAELAAQSGDAAGAVELYRRVEARFEHALDDPRLSDPAARGVLDRALRLSDIGRTPEAMSTLDAFIARVEGRDANLRPVLAQAYYWRGRLARESGDLHGAETFIARILDLFSGDADPDVRVWAANALFSQWQSREELPGGTDPIARFLALFSDDDDVRIRRLDARARLRSAVEAHEAGDTGTAVAVLTQLVERHADSGDDEVADTVRTAGDNLRILRAASAGTTIPDEASSTLRARIADADALIAVGRLEEALPLLEGVAGETQGATDPDIALIGLVAFDLIGSILHDAGRWPELVHVARQALLLPDGADHRAQRIQARAHIRLAIAFTRLGETGAAIDVYGALDALAEGSHDDEVISARQTAAYNRAVLLDDAQHPAAADAYRHVVAVHATSVATPARRLRQIKALRNLALLTEQSGHVADTVNAHLTVIQLALQAPDSEASARARTSAFDLAALYERTSQPQAAIDLLEWILAAPPLAFTRQDHDTAARAVKRLKKAAHRLR